MGEKVLCKKLVSIVMTTLEIFISLISSMRIFHCTQIYYVHNYICTRYYYFILICDVNNIYCNMIPVFTRHISTMAYIMK